MLSILFTFNGQRLKTSFMRLLATHYGFSCKNTRVWTEKDTDEDAMNRVIDTMNMRLDVLHQVIKII